MTMGRVGASVDTGFLHVGIDQVYGESEAFDLARKMDHIVKPMKGGGMLLHFLKNKNPITATPPTLLKPSHLHTSKP
ncbi:hypothetical protein L6452_18421 [Arctium lappa]|uniref:Uncharacterized protein n=1 Tax=Arctium lappa TaxID=4217 RepID=A0ACB9C670_ARCLA|nr:hypothetical protein L6452_18421 [Arctium lappa]